MKIVWLASYPLNNIEDQLVLTGKIGLLTTNWLVNLAKGLSSIKEIDLHIITHSSKIPFTQEIKKDNITYHIIKYNFPFSNKGFPNKFRWDIFTLYSGFIKNALKEIKNIQPDIIHAHGTEHAYSLCAYYAGVPNITSIQGIVSEIYKITPTFNFWLQKHIENYSIKKNKYFGCRTDWDKNIIKEKNPESIIYYLPEIISDIFFNLKWQPINYNTLLYVGSLTKHKGLDILLYAIAELKSNLPEINLRIIGQANNIFKKKIDILIDKFDIKSNIQFLGSKLSAEIASEMAKATIYVHPSLIDNSPNSLCEAMAVGMPCIASNVGGIPSIIENKKNGILFNRGDAKSLANSVKFLFSDRNRLCELGIEARETAKKWNSSETNTKITTDIYSTLLKNH